MTPEEEKAHKELSEKLAKLDGEHRKALDDLKMARSAGDAAGMVEIRKALEGFAGDLKNVRADMEALAHGNRNDVRSGATDEGDGAEGAGAPAGEKKSGGFWPWEWFGG